MIDSTRTIGWSSAKREFFFSLLFFRASRIRVDSFPDECSLFVDASSSHSRFLGGNVDYDVRCIQKGTRGRWSRTRHFKIIRPSFSIVSPSVIYSLFASLAFIKLPIYIYILMKNRIVRFFVTFFEYFVSPFERRRNFYSRNFYTANTNWHRWAARHRCHVNYDASGVIREWNRVS